MPPRTALAAGLALAALAAAPSAHAQQAFPAHQLVVAAADSDSLVAYGGTQPILDGALQADAGAPFATGSGLAFGLGGQHAGALAFGPDGRLYVAALTSGAVHVYDGDGQLVDTFGEDADSFFPASLAFGPGGHLFVGSSLGHDPIHEFDVDGTLLRSFGPDGGLNITGLAFGPDGHLFVSSYLADVVKELDGDGRFVRNVGAGQLLDPRGLAFGPDGLLYVTSSTGDAVLVFDAEGALVTTLGQGLLDEPTGLAFAPDGRLFVASAGTDSVAVFSDPLGGGPFTEFGGVELGGPVGLAFAPLRLTTTLKGSLGGVAASTKLSEKAVLSVRPGSGRVQLQLLDEQGALAGLLGSPWASFHGFEAPQGAGDKTLLLQGLQLTARPTLDGTASLALRLSGKPGANGGLRARKAQGSLHVATPDGVLVASVKAGKPQN